MGLQFLYKTTKTWVCDGCQRSEKQEVEQHPAMNSIELQNYPAGWVSALVFIKLPTYMPYTVEKSEIGRASSANSSKIWYFHEIPEEEAKLFYWCPDCSKKFLTAK